MQKNWVEWTLFGVSCALVAATLAYLSVEAWRVDGDPPRIEIEVGQALPHSEYFAVPLTVRNTGDQTAEAVRVEVTLVDQDGNDERALVELAFLPRGSTRKAWVSFQSDPRQAKQILARPVGFETP